MLNDPNIRSDSVADIITCAIKTYRGFYWKSEGPSIPAEVASVSVALDRRNG